MYSLANDQLRIELLDPVADRVKLGPRFAWGGYIWQVYDLQTGPLLTGPEWPDPNPNPFNGQGLPESFRHRTRDGRPLTWFGTKGVALGAGELALSSAGEVEITKPAVWQVTSFTDRLVFHTRQQAAGFHYELNRKIELTGRSILSMSQLTNHGPLPLELEWFAHPFFALSNGLIRADLRPGVTLKENPGFSLDHRGLTQKRVFKGIQDGHMDFLEFPENQNVVAKLTHPTLQHVTFTSSFAPSECVIWGNGNTFSIEPYQKISLTSGKMKQWSLRYDFGPRAETKL